MPRVAPPRRLAVPSMPGWRAESVLQFDLGGRLGLAWVILLGFLRLTTNPAIFPSQLSPAAAIDKVDNWLGLEQIRLVRETRDHWHIQRELLAATGTAGNLTNDSQLAALALSHGATLVSFDHDFARLPNLRWERPAETKEGIESGPDESGVAAAPADDSLSSCCSS